MTEGQDSGSCGTCSELMLVGEGRDPCGAPAASTEQFVSVGKLSKMPGKEGTGFAR